MPYQEFTQFDQFSFTMDLPISIDNRANNIPNIIPLTEELGYFVGFVLADGNHSTHR